MKFKKYIPLLFLLFSMGCNDDDQNNIAPVEERVAAAINQLKSELIAPANGWRVNYQPTPGSGVFFMLLNFNEDGTVTIQSDVMDNDGEFAEQTIPYRIDNALGLELIFETYGVFHYLFEKDQATFGGEFEFNYSGKQNENLVFVSKSDFSNKTMFVLEPASAGDENLFSTELSANLSKFGGLTPQIFGPVAPVQHLILEDKNISIFWSIDLSKRIIDFDMAGVGTTVEEISSGATNVQINHSSGYAFMNGNLILLDPLTLQLNGEEILIEKIKLINYSENGPSFCNLNPVNTPVYEGTIDGVGNVVLQKSLFESEGMGFQPMANRYYSVNVFFVFDGEGNSLSENGIIAEKFPAANGFAINYGYNSVDLPANAVGLFVEDADGMTQIYYREFEPTTTEGNKITINLTNNFYYTATPPAGTEQKLIEVTDEIFQGNEIYASNLPGQGIPVFRLFNPCNQYEFFLVP